MDIRALTADPVVQGGIVYYTPPKSSYKDCLMSKPPLSYKDHLLMPAPTPTGKRNMKGVWGQRLARMEAAYPPEERFWNSYCLGVKGKCLLLHFLQLEREGKARIKRSKDGCAGVIKKVHIKAKHREGLNRSFFPLTGSVGSRSYEGRLVYTTLQLAGFRQYECPKTGTIRYVHRPDYHAYSNPRYYRQKRGEAE
jgi:hypothetical protein